MIDVYYTRTGSNCFLLINEVKEAVLIDPGYTPGEELIDHVKKLNVDIKAILITHGHYDHIYHLEDVIKLYPNAKVYISYLDSEFLTNDKLNLSSEIGENIKIISYKPENLITVVDNDIINEANFEIKVISTPFHTIGSVCYLVESEKALFSGDTLFFTTIGRTDLPTGDASLIPSSLRKIKNLSDDLKVYPGHGPITPLIREKKHNSYLKNI